MTVQLNQASDSSEVVEISLSEARDRLAELVDAVRDDGKFIYLTRRGKCVCVLMPADIGENYEHIEDEYWARRADEAHASLESGEDEVISFAQLIAAVEGAS